MDTGHIAQSSIQWAHHCPALCRQGRPNFLGQLSSCQLPTPFQHGGGGRYATVWTGPRYAATRAVWSSLHGSKAGPSGLRWRRTQLQDMVHPAPHTKTRGSHPGARAHSRDTLGPAGHLVFPVFLEHFYAPVGLGDIRNLEDEVCRRLPRQGFPPAPPRAFRVWGGWGEWGPPIRALGTWELTAERRPGRRRSPSLSGPSAPETGW